MQYLQIILAFSGFVALIYVFKITNKISRYLTIAALVALILSLIPLGPVAIDGYTLYGLITFSAFLTTNANDEIPNNAKILLYVFLVFTAILPVSYIAKLQGMPYISLLGFAPVFMLTYMAIYKRVAYKNELGYLGIFAAFSLVRAIAGLDFLLKTPV